VWESTEGLFMTTIAILGGTGYAGSHIAAEALSRGFHVVSWSRSRPSEPIEGVTYNHGDLLDEEVLRSVVDGADVVVGALSPRGALDGSLRFLYSQVADLAQKAGVRLGIVGGAGSLRVEEGGRTLASLPDFPEEFRSEAGQLAAVLEDLRSRSDDLQWFFVSPAGNFGSYNPGTHTGHFRLGGDVLLTDENGVSDISGADFAQAFVDEIETPTHTGQRFTVAY